MIFWIWLHFAEPTKDLILLLPNRAVESSQSSILKNYLSAPDIDTRHIIPNQIFSECFNLTFAGIGGTDAALTVTLYELGSPSGRKWQDRIRAESRVGNSAGTSPMPFAGSDQRDNAVVNRPHSDVSPSRALQRREIVRSPDRLRVRRRRVSPANQGEHQEYIGSFL